MVKNTEHFVWKHISKILWLYTENHVIPKSSKIYFLMDKYTLFLTEICLLTVSSYICLTFKFILRYSFQRKEHPQHKEIFWVIVELS